MAALYLLYRTRPEDRNASGIHAVLVDAADEAAARAAAIAAAPNGETRVPATWAAVQIAASAALPESPLWIEGDAVSLLGMTRGGNPI
jgi:hypothetical protein